MPDTWEDIAAFFQSQPLPEWKPDQEPEEALRELECRPPTPLLGPTQFWQPRESPGDRAPVQEGAAISPIIPIEQPGAYKPAIVAVTVVVMALVLVVVAVPAVMIVSVMCWLRHDMGHRRQTRP